MGDDDIGVAIRCCECVVTLGVDGHDPRSQAGELSSTEATGAVDEHHVPASDRAERFEGTGDLLLDIKASCETLTEGGPEVERKVCHGTGVYGAVPARPGPVPVT